MPKKILVVEDSLAYQSGIERNMRWEGYDVEIAETVDEARQKLAEDNFALVIADIRLPDDFEGLELVEELREREKQQGKSDKERVPIIFTTIVHPDTVRPRVDKIGYHAFFVKPYYMSELTVNVMHLLGKSEDSNTND